MGLLLLVGLGLGLGGGGGLGQRGRGLGGRLGSLGRCGLGGGGKLLGSGGGGLQNVPAPGAVIVILHPGVGIVGGHLHRLPGLSLHPVAGDIPGRNARTAQQHRRRRGKVDAVALGCLLQEPQGEILPPLGHGGAAPVIGRTAADVVRHIFHRPLHAFCADAGGLNQRPGPAACVFWQGKPLIPGVGGQRKFPQTVGVLPTVPVRLRPAVGQEHLSLREGGEQGIALVTAQGNVHNPLLCPAAGQNILPVGGRFPGGAGVHIVILGPQVHRACLLRRHLRYRDAQQQLGGQAGQLHPLPGPQTGEQVHSLALEGLGQLQHCLQNILPQGLGGIDIAGLGEAIKQQPQSQSHRKGHPGGQAAGLNSVFPADAVRQQQQAQRQKQTEQIHRLRHRIRHHQGGGQSEQQQQHREHIAPAAAYRAAHRKNHPHPQHQQGQVCGGLLHLQHLGHAEAVAAVIGRCHGAQHTQQLGAEGPLVPQPHCPGGSHCQKQCPAPAAKQQHTAQQRPQQPGQQHRLLGGKPERKGRNQASRPAPRTQQGQNHGLQKGGELTLHRRHLRCDTASWPPDRHPRHRSGRPEGCTAACPPPWKGRRGSPHGRPVPPGR